MNFSMWAKREEHSINMQYAMCTLHFYRAGPVDDYVQDFCTECIGLPSWILIAFRRGTADLLYKHSARYKCIVQIVVPYYSAFWVRRVYGVIEFESAIKIRTIHDSGVLQSLKRVGVIKWYFYISKNCERLNAAKNTHHIKKPSNKSCLELSFIQNSPRAYVSIPLTSGVRRLQS